MKALAWDDKPQYLELLQRHLVRLGIQLEIVTSETEFVERFLSEEVWDFVITDLLLEDSPVLGEDEIVGLRLASEIAASEKGRALPIFVITGRYDRITPDSRLPNNVVIKSKSTSPGWQAGEIRQELSRRGLFVDRKRVFLIHGHDKTAPGATGRVGHFLRGNEIKVVTLGDSALKVEIAQGLLSKMNESGAFVAICTPDDPAGSIWQPRPNVFLEIGLALGLSRGPQRLILLQRWGPGKEEQAVLPSDLGGLLTIRFEGEINLQFEKLTEHLRELGIEL